MKSLVAHLHNESTISIISYENTSNVRFAHSPPWFLPEIAVANQQETDKVNKQICLTFPTLISLILLPILWFLPENGCHQAAQHKKTRK